MARRAPFALLLLVVLALVPRPALGLDCRAVVDFARYTVGDYPADWRPKEEQARAIYRVLEEGGVRFIRGTADGSGVQIGKEFDWDLKTYPVLSWRWRPRAFPMGADEREGGRNDSVLGVYAVPHSPVSVKTVIRLEFVVPAGATAAASRGLTCMLVLRSGRPDGAGWWRSRRTWLRLGASSRDAEEPPRTPS
jgi:hypothetical protein